jgi:uncharacterized protein (TIGR03437 family)
VVNAAGVLSSVVAGDEIVSMFGITGISGDTPATSLPLGTTLGGVSLTITDSTGATRQPLLYGVFGSAGQINFLVPADLARGLAVVTVNLPGGATQSTVINIGTTAAGIFSASMNGQGVYAGQAVYQHANNTQTVADSVTGNPAVPNPVKLGTPGDQVVLVLYATGLRNAKTVTATINGVAVPVAFYGAQGQYVGLDQINLGPLPSSLAGTGSVNVVITADGQPANTVTVTFQ